MGAARSTARTSVAFAIVAMVGFVTTYRIAVHTARGQALDLTALRGEAVQPRPIRRIASGLLGTISSASLVGVMVVLVVIAVLRGRFRLAVVVGTVVTCSVVSAEILKHTLSRPLLATIGFDYVPVNTLPSGHSTVALSVVVAAILVAPRRHQALVALVGAPYAVGVGIATVAAHWHRPSDVVAAAFVVAAWTFVGLVVLDRIAVVRPATPAAWGRFIAPVLVLLLVAAVGVLAATTLLGLSLAAPQADATLQPGTLRSAAAFGFSTACIAAIELSFIGALLWMLRTTRLTQ